MVKNNNRPLKKDFEKIKNKVGKKKQEARNATNVDYT